MTRFEYRIEPALKHRLDGTLYKTYVVQKRDNLSYYFGFSFGMITLGVFLPISIALFAGLILAFVDIPFLEAWQDIKEFENEENAIAYLNTQNQNKSC